MKPRPGGFQIALLVYFLTNSVFLVHAAPLSTTQNSTLSVPAATLAAAGLPGAANLVGTNFMVATMEGATLQGGRASLLNQQQWVRKYNGGLSGNDRADSYRAVLRDDGLVVNGHSYLDGSEDFATVAYAADGTPLWTNRYDGPAHGPDSPTSLGASKNGDVWVLGISRLNWSDYNLVDGIAIKYASNGISLWTNRYHFETNAAYPSALAVDNSGNAYMQTELVHWSSDSGSTTVGQTLAKYDPLGNTVWTKEYLESAPDSGQGLHELRLMALDDAGNLIVTGRAGTEHYNLGSAIVKFAGDGTALWTNYHNFGYFFFIETLTVDPRGDILLTGEDMSDWKTTYVILKCSKDGASLWTNYLAGPDYDGGCVPQMLCEWNGDVLLLGGSPGADSPGLYQILKLSSQGVPLWTNQITDFGPTNGMIDEATLDRAGNIYLMGDLKTSENSNTYVLIKYASDGTLLWTKHFFPDSLRDMVIDPSGSLYLTGTSGSEFVTYKFSESVVYTPPRNFTGTDTVTYVLADNLGNSATGTVEVAVTPGSFQFSPSMSTLTPPNIQLQVEGAPGANSLILEASEDLVTWQPISTNAVSNGSARFLDPAPAGRTQRFYRVLQQQ